MSWLRLDDGFGEHPKVGELTEVKRWRWLLVLLYCSRYETDGRVPGSVLRRHRLDGRELLELGLLDEGEHEGEPAWFVHDFLDYNPSQAERERERERWRDHQRASRNRRNVRGGVRPESRAGQATSARTASPSPGRSKDSSDVEGEPAALDVGGELAAARLLQAAGELPPERVDFIRGACARLPESVPARVLESLDGGSVRDRGGYIVGALTRELRERGLS